jgi:hypothetical protein
MITPAPSNSFKLDLLTRAAEDEYRIALYASDADLSAETVAYTSEGEVQGLGYEPGGIRLKNVRAMMEDGIAFLAWDNPTWENIRVSARGALIYNASRDNRAVAVLDFGADISSNGPYTVILPEPRPDTALIRIV